MQAHIHLRVILQLYLLGRLGEGMLVAHIDLGLAITSFLGFDQDDTIRGPGPVEGRRRRILHDGEALDIIGLKTRQIRGGQFDIVDQDQGIRVGPEGGDAPDEE